jgi:putative methyltransferase (TIGR04325 family)
MKGPYKQLIKNFTPPIFLKIYKNIRRAEISFSGIYTSWQDALRQSTGYDSDLILDKTKTALLKVKLGEAVYERDSVLFDKTLYSFPVLAGLLHAALTSKGKLNVLDFGGSLGSSYYQFEKFLPGLNSLKWNIVEQPKFVTCGRKFFQNERLRFYYDIDECMRREKPNVVLLSSVIQYIEDPYALLSVIIEREIDYIIIDRTPFSSMEREFLTVQIVPPSIYKASYPSWIFSVNKMLGMFSSKYSLLAEFESMDGVIERWNEDIRYRGFIFRHNLQQ